MFSSRTYTYMVPYDLVHMIFHIDCPQNRVEYLMCENKTVQFEIRIGNPVMLAVD